MIIKESCLIARKAYLIDVLPLLRPILHRFKLIENKKMFSIRWAIIEESSCLIARKALLIDVLSFLDQYYINLTWFDFFYVSDNRTKLSNRKKKTLLIDVYFPS